MVVGFPKQTTISAIEVQESSHDGLTSIVQATREILKQTPPELSADTIDRGIMFTGSGALLANLDKLVTCYLQVLILTVDSPFGAVVLGTGALLKDIERHQGRQEKILSELLTSSVQAYRKFILPTLPPAYRYYPACSGYMIGSLRKHGSLKGLIMGIVRIIRCNPLARGGIDPVPDYFTLRRNSHPEKYKDPIIAKKSHPK